MKKKKNVAKPLPIETNQPFGNKMNVLMIMADEFRFPIAKGTGGMIDDLKNILGFQDVTGEQISRDAARLFPGFMRLRENAVSLKNHTVATSACVPSRAALFTGQYGSVQGVTQTDGVFKSAAEVNWLEPGSVPTMGDWFKANNYSTHYFGKCHFAHPPTPSLLRWGFDNWETSFPEPHGTLKNNLGMYRDQGFTDLVTTFLRRKGMALDYDEQVGLIEMDDDLTDRQKEEAIDAIEMKPWFAVASFTNPHDVTTWPILPSKAAGVELTPEGSPIMEEPLGIPEKNARSTPPEKGTWTFNMNPGGIDDTYATLPDTWDESLLEKPSCQFDYSIKLGIALAAKTGHGVVARNTAEMTGLPLTLAANTKVWSKAYIDYYTYLHHLLDQQIDRVLKTLDDAGLRDNTIVVFVPDHGEYGASHGMLMQKWHTAYQEAIHVPVVVSLPHLTKEMVRGPQTPRQVEALTSHVDLAPTLLGLTGVTEDNLEELAKRLHVEGDPFVGADLSGLIADNKEDVPDRFGGEGAVRDAVLFTTSDMITEPKTTNEKNIDWEERNRDYQVYLRAVESYKDKYSSSTDEEDADKKSKTARLLSGPVIQPAEVHCVRSRDAEGDWKLVRYRDYHNPTVKSSYQWELYNLENDASEANNLLQFDSAETFVVNTILDQSVLDLYSSISIPDKATALYEKMKELITDMMKVDPEG